MKRSKEAQERKRQYKINLHNKKGETQLKDSIYPWLQEDAETVKRLFGIEVIEPKPKVNPAVRGNKSVTDILNAFK